MKKFYLFLLVPITSVAQKEQPIQLPMKDGKVVYEVIDSSLSKPKNEIYSAATIWMANAFASAKDVNQVSDKETGEILGKGNFKFHFHFFVSNYEDRCNFSIRISCRDNKYRIQIYDIIIESIGSDFGTSPLESYAMKPEKSPNKAVIKEVNAGILNMISEAKRAISTKTADSF